MFNHRHTTLSTLAAITILTGCTAPNTCDTNHTSQETRIETRNYEAGHFEWREQGKYNNPNEGWVTENNDPKETNTGYSYKKTMGWDKITCNSEQDNGKIVEHAHLDEFYIQK